MYLLVTFQTVKYIFSQPVIISLFATLTCVCFYYLKSELSKQRISIWIVYSLMFAVAAIVFTGNALYVILHPGVWDFTAFYLWGKTAVAGHNYFLPENLAIVYNSVSLPFSDSELEEFIDYIVNVGFLYPPPTIFYFLPLGFLSFKTSLIVWTIFNFIFVLGSIYIIFDQYFKSLKLNGLFFVTILLFILTPSLLTVYFSQTNFILLFLLLLMKKYSDKNVSGIFLSIAFFTKPYMVIFIVFFILRMQWKTIFYFFTSTLIIGGITLVLFGKETFASYFLDNPSLRLPEEAFSEDVNQSLNAILLRNNIITMENQLVYLFIVSVIILITGIYLFFLFRRKLNDYIWVVLLLVGLLVYPGTLVHYGTLLLFIIFQFFDEKIQLGFKQYFSVPIVAVFYYLSAISVFTAICFLLGLIILKSFITLNHCVILPKTIKMNI